MRRLPLVCGIAATMLGSSLTSGCGLGDVFATPGPAADVVFVFSGDTLIGVGDTIPLVVSVQAGGRTVLQPRLVVTSLDPTLLEVTAGGDTLIGLSPGRALLEVVLVGSVITGTAPDSVRPFRVRP